MRLGNVGRERSKRGEIVYLLMRLCLNYIMDFKS